MNESQNAELLELVKSLTSRIEELEIRVKSLQLHHQDVPEETVVAIAAAVSAYLGFRAKKRQASFVTSSNWLAGTRRLQHAHQPLHLR